MAATFGEKFTWRHWEQRWQGRQSGASNGLERAEAREK
jgi:hypothetical protein